MADQNVVIYHNPACGTSRNALALLREKGVEPKVVEYLKTGWTKDGLKALFTKMGVHAREALRLRGADAEALGLTDPAVSEDKIIDAMVRDPNLVNRPIVLTPKGAALCRPVDLVLGLI
jgi:arsenate reductase